jgi:hypothetical protein
MRIPKECPKCHCKYLHSETGPSVIREFYNGKLVVEKNWTTTRRLFCDGCFEELSEGLR